MIRVGDTVKLTRSPLASYTMRCPYAVVAYRSTWSTNVEVRYEGVARVVRQLIRNEYVLEVEQL